MDMPRTFWSTSVRADKKIMGISVVTGLSFRIRQTSRPSMPGIITSKRIRSGLRVLANSMASGPLLALRGTMSIRCKYPSTRETLVLLSSTTSTNGSCGGWEGRLCVSGAAVFRLADCSGFRWCESVIRIVHSPEQTKATINHSADLGGYYSQGLSDPKRLY